MTPFAHFYNIAVCVHFTINTQKKHFSRLLRKEDELGITWVTRLTWQVTIDTYVLLRKISGHRHTVVFEETYQVMVVTPGELGRHPCSGQTFLELQGNVQLRVDTPGDIGRHPRSRLYVVDHSIYIFMKNLGLHPRLAELQL